jgi:HD-like signal output (HDOD) protein
MRVLFVDDEPRVLEALQRMLLLSPGTWEVETASSGARALDLLASSRFDVIVTDMRMPGMDGGQLLAQVNERWPSMTRIVLSGQAEHQHALRTLGNAHDFLAKPCSAKLLTEVVERTFRRASLPSSTRVKDLAAAVHRLPSLPKVHERILKVLDGPEASVTEAADLVEQDPGLSANVLRIGNSPVVAQGTIVDDVRQGTVRLGLDLLRALVLTERAACGMQFARLERLQTAALNVARVAGLVLPPENRRAALMAALLCDIGTLVLEQGAPDEIAAVYAAAEEDGLPIHVAEKALLGSSHAEVGGYVLGLWGVPTAIVDAVLGHHELGCDAALLSAAVHVAHRIVAGEVVSHEAAVRARVETRLDAIREAYHRERGSS